MQSFKRINANKLIFQLALLIGMQTFCSFAFGYIPPSNYILKSWLNKHRGLKTLKIKTTVIALENGKPTDIQFKEHAVYSLEKKVFKSFASDTADKKLYSVEKDISMLSPVSKLLMSSDLGEMSQVLKDLKIPIRTEADLLALSTEEERIQSESEFLSRLNGRVLWVIGQNDTKGQEFFPQIGFEKDTFLPLQFVFSSPTGAKTKDQFDIRFDGYRNFHDFPFPRSLTVIKNGKGLTLLSQVTDISVNTEVSLGKPASSSGLESGFTELGNTSPNALRELIRFYYDVVR